jgi:S1-C subfamily serine protease
MKRFLLFLAVLLFGLGAFAGHLIGGSAPATTTAAAATASSSSQAQGSAVNQTTSNAIVSPSASSIDQATEGAYATVSPSVVSITSVGVGSGSGIIYDSKGDIVTNYHVINGASSLSVLLSSGQTYKATVVGTDTADDLAVIHINASNLKPAQFAANGGYQVGQPVLAIGSPLGLNGSVTFGLISGEGRVEQEPNGSYIPNALQTSAPINPGNSGGALITLEGVVVGMPTLEQTSTTDGTAAQNVGFAIPSQRIVDIANQIVATGKVTHTDRAYLGIAPSDNTGQSYGFGQGFSFGQGFGQGGQSTPVTGAIVAQVSPNGPAGKAGIQQGDVITSANGTKITDSQDLLQVLANEKPGDTLSLQVNRNGQTMTVQVHLGELPA